MLGGRERKAIDYQLCKTRGSSIKRAGPSLNGARGKSILDMYGLDSLRVHTRSSPTKSRLLNIYCLHIMSLTCTNTARCCARLVLRNSLRPISLAPSTTSQRQRRRPTQRWASTESATNPKITGIVDQISQLTLLETADLVSSLKVCYAHSQHSVRKCQHLAYQELITEDYTTTVTTQHPRYANGRFRRLSTCCSSAR